MLGGLWWVANPPEDDAPYKPPEHQVAGEFTDSDTGPRELTVLGSMLSDSKNALSSLPDSPAKEIDTIWGISIGGDHLSLFDVSRSSVRLTIPSIFGGNEGWYVNWYTSGRVWVTKDEDIDLVTIKFDVLDDWASEYLQLVNHKCGFEGKALHFADGQSHTASLNDATITLRFDSNLLHSPATYRTRRSSSLEIASTMRLDKVAEEWITPLNILMEFLTGNPSRVASIEAEIKEMKTSPRRFLELHPLIQRPTEKRDYHQIHRDMIATRSTLKRHGLSFSSMMQNYQRLKESEKHLSVLSCLVHSQSRLIDQTIDARFLAVCKAMEQFHSEVIGGTAIPVDEHSKRMEDVVKGAPEEWKSWVRESLAGKNHKGFKRQIDEVVDHADGTGQIIKQIWPKFARQIVDCRSTVAHGGITINSRTWRYQVGLLALQWLLRHVCLVELGVPTDQVNLLIQENERFKQEIQFIEELANRTS